MLWQVQARRTDEKLTAGRVGMNAFAAIVLHHRLDDSRGQHQSGGAGSGSVRPACSKTTLNQIDQQFRAARYTQREPV